MLIYKEHTGNFKSKPHDFKTLCLHAGQLGMFSARSLKLLKVSEVCLEMSLDFNNWSSV